MLPQDGVGGWAPSPRELSEASIRIAWENPMVPWTTNGEMTLGTMCFPTTTQRLAPSARTAPTHSFSRSPPARPPPTPAARGGPAGRGGAGGEPVLGDGGPGMDLAPVAPLPAPAAGGQRDRHRHVPGRRQQPPPPGPPPAPA